MVRPSLAIVDDDAVYRMLLRRILTSRDQFRLAGEAEDGEAAIELARRLKPDIMLLDHHMPRIEGLQAIPKILAVSPRTRIILHTGSLDEGLAALVANAGAHLVSKDADWEMLESTIQSLIPGVPSAKSAD